VVSDLFSAKRSARKIQMMPLRRRNRASWCCPDGQHRFVAIDIRDGAIEALDKIVDPLVLRLIERTVGLLTVPVARYRCRRPRRQRAFFRDGHQATSPRLSASLSISCWHTRHVNVCRSKASPRTGCGVRRVKRIRFLHFGQTGLSVAPKRVGMANSFWVGRRSTRHPN